MKKNKNTMQNSEEIEETKGHTENRYTLGQKAIRVGKTVLQVVSGYDAFQKKLKPYLGDPQALSLNLQSKRKASLIQEITSTKHFVRFLRENNITSIVLKTDSIALVRFVIQIIKEGYYLNSFHLDFPDFWDSIGGVSRHPIEDFPLNDISDMLALENSPIISLKLVGFFDINEKFIKILTQNRVLKELKLHPLGSYSDEDTFVLLITAFITDPNCTLRSLILDNDISQDATKNIISALMDRNCSLTTCKMGRNPLIHEIALYDIKCRILEPVFANMDDMDIHIMDTILEYDESLQAYFDFRSKQHEKSLETNIPDLLRNDRQQAVPFLPDYSSSSSVSFKSSSAPSINHVAAETDWLNNQPSTG